jgi:DNA polymerase sigma
MDTSKSEINLKNLKGIFWEANRAFLENHASLLKRELSERCLCGALMHELNKQLEKNGCNNYYADIEFNRAFENTINNVKHLPDEEGTPKRVFPDIIMHSRGEVSLDNLIALEMKKSSANQEDKEKDRNRLKKMTKQNCNEGCYSYKYKLGVYYEVNFEEKQIIVDFYQSGRKISNDSRIIEYKITEERGLEFIRERLLDSDE